MERFLSLAIFFFFFFMGMILGWSRLLPKKWYSFVNRGITVVLYLLLFFMGVKTALIQGIEEQLIKVGVTAFLYALGGVAFSAGGVILISVLRKKKRAASEGRTSHSLKSLLKEPCIMIGTVLFGFMVQRFTAWFTWVDSWTLFNQDVSTLILFTMLFLVGLGLVMGGVSLVSSVKDVEVVLLPLLTVIFTLASGFLLSLVFPQSTREGLAVSGGLGWYSFSGVYLTEAGDPILGSIAFLSNLFREFLAVLAIPLLGALGFPYAAISTAGATSMDVTLPIVEHSCGDTHTPASMYHGLVLTILVPLLVPLLYGV